MIVAVITRKAKVIPTTADIPMVVMGIAILNRASVVATGIITLICGKAVTIASSSAQGTKAD